MGVESRFDQEKNHFQNHSDRDRFIRDQFSDLSFNLSVAGRSGTDHADLIRCYADAFSGRGSA